MAEVFISHSSKDAVIAQNLCTILEQNGISCWMAPRNIMPGDDWATAITKAITTTKVFIIIYSANSAASTEVPKEIMLAGSRHSYIIPYKIDDTPLRENFEYHLGASHWISADIARGDYKATELLAAVNSGLGNGAPTVNNVVTVNNYGAGAAPVAQAAQMAYTAPAVSAPTPKKHNKLLPVIIASAAAVLVAAIALVVVFVGGSDDGDERDRSSSETETIETEERQERDEQGSDKDEALHGVIDLHPYDSSNITEYKGRSDEFLVFGEAYNTGYMFSQYDAWMMFNVADCTEVTFTVARIDGTPDNDREIYVYLDGTEYDHYVIKASAADEITIPLEDAKILKLSASGNVNSPALGLYNVTFKGNTEEPDEAASEESDSSAASGTVELTAYDSSNAEFYDGRHEEFLVFGDSYNKGYKFAQYDAWMMFNVRDCDEMTFTAGRIDGTPDKAREIYVYLDGVEYDHYTITSSATENITIPLDGATILRIAASGNASFPELGIFNISFSGEQPQEIEQAELVTEAYDSVNATLCNDRHTQFMIFGEAHNKGYKLSQYDSWLAFNANGFTELSFTAGRIDGTNVKDRDIHIYLDGQEYDYFTVTSEAVESITVPLNGAKIVRIFSGGNASYPELGLYDITFSGEHTPLYSESDGSAVITAYEYENATEYDKSHEKFLVFGEQHDKGYVMSQYDSRLLFNVYGYTEVSFTAARIDGDNVKDRTIEIYLDGEKYDQYTVVQDSAEEITVPLNGARTMQIVASGNASYSALGLFDFSVTGEKLALKQAQVADGVYAPESIALYTSAEVETMDGQEFIVCGETHEYGYVSEQYGEFSLVFETKDYSEFRFTAARLDGTNYEARRITVYLDGVEVESYDIGPEAAPMEVTVQLNDAKTVEIRGESGNAYSPKLAFYDVYFK